MDLYGKVSVTISRLNLEQEQRGVIYFTRLYVILHCALSNIVKRQQRIKKKKKLQLPSHLNVRTWRERRARQTHFLLVLISREPAASATERVPHQKRRGQLPGAETEFYACIWHTNQTQIVPRPPKKRKKTGLSARRQRRKSVAFKSDIHGRISRIDKMTSCPLLLV